MSLEAIGQKLKSAREGQGLSLRQIYERTKIPINHLQALDSGQPDDLPEPVYVAGFIRRYAECIGLDGQVLVDEYKRRDGGEGNGNGKPKAQAQPLYVTQDYLKHTRIDDRPPSYKLWPFYLAALVIVMAFFSWYSMQMANNNQQDNGAPSLKESLSHLQPTPTPPAGTANAPGSSDSQGASATGSGRPAGAPPSASPESVTLSANKHVWVEVKRLQTGDTLYTGSLEAGTQRVFDDPQGLRVTAGNGGSLSVEFKGKIEPFGQTGKPSERTFSGSTMSAGTIAQPAATTASQGTSASSTSSSATATSKSKKPTTTANAVSKPAVKHVRSDDAGTRSIPGDEGTRSIDVPYRYSEGRLDAN